MCWFAALGTAVSGGAAATAAGTGLFGMSAATTAGLSATASLAGLGMSAMSAMQQSQAAKSAASYNAAVQNNNAIAAEYQAQDSYRRGESAVEDHLRKVAALRGKQTATLAANGVSLDEGSALNILTDTELFGEMDANTIRYNAAREAWGYKAQASNYTAQGELASMSAASQNPMLTGASSLLTGAGVIADRWYAYGRAK